MRSSTSSDVLARDVRIHDESLEVDLADGRRIAVPIAWFPRLARATADERREWRLIGGGIGIRWDAIDEDVSVQRLLSS